MVTPRVAESVSKMSAKIGHQQASGHPKRVREQVIWAENFGEAVAKKQQRNYARHDYADCDEDPTPG